MKGSDARQWRGRTAIILAPISPNSGTPAVNKISVPIDAAVSFVNVCEYAVEYVLVNWAEFDPYNV